MPPDTMDPALVLLVDDDRRNLVALEAILDGLGYRIVTAESGADALEIALRDLPAVVLLDVLMPGMDGFEVAEQLKSIERTRDVPIVFLTAVATDVRYIYRAYEVGALDYLVKPLDAEVVRRKVAVFVELVRRRQENERQAQALREADRRRHELEIAELRVASDRRYRKLVEGINHAIGWTMDDALRFTFVSRQAPRILGYQMAELGKPGFWSASVHPEDVDGLLATFRRALAEGVELVCDHRLIHADGRVLWFHTGVSGERGPAPGDPPELHGISVDVTDIKRAQQEAERTTHVREELIAIVAHDLRNPLSTIASTAGLLETVADRTEDSRVQRGAHAIGRAVDHMSRLLEDLLDFALIQAERMTIKPEPLDAEELLGEVFEQFAPIAATRKLQLERRMDEPLEIRGDRVRLLQILSNLVGNAIKFTPDGGTIVLRAERSGTDALFTIRDTGRGMTETEASRMWERYWRGRNDRSVEAADTPSNRGIGLGLSIAQGLVEAHGGRIWARSKVGDGTTISFTIPLVDSPADPPSIPG
jgi:PAS domain S-box-containing protein